MVPSVLTAQLAREHQADLRRAALARRGPTAIRSRGWRRSRAG
jgi:hypothetical protein